MKRILLAGFLALAPTLPAAAQEGTDPDTRPPIPFLEDWANRTEELMRELMEEVGPEMEQFMAEMLPRLQELADMVGGLRNYEPPEVLPNGDIIIRRKPDAPPLPEDFNPEGGPIDL